VIACLSSPNIIVRTIEVPKKVNVDKEKLEVARDYIPYKVEDCKIEMYVINEDIPESPDKKEVLLIAFLLQDYVVLSDIIDSLKFERVAIEFDELGVWRLLEGANYNNFRESDNIVIDLGYLSTKIMVFNRGKLKQLRILRVGGEELKNLFVEKLNMTDFENIFHSLSFSEANYLSVLTKFFEPIIKELKRTIISYKTKFSFSNIYLIGGLSYISGVNEFLSKELSIPVVCINLENFKNIAKIDKKIENTFKNEFNLYVNALGLALGHGQRKFAL
jgi:Tfp pilus assembly PilM family ATPase